MRVRTGATRGRAGFTLVEMVVVIGIIAVLASLLLGAISKARVFAQRSAATSEMSQIETATVKFKTDFGFNPPQQIQFPTPGSPRNALQERTAQLLTKMFRAYNPDTDHVAARDATAAEPTNLVYLDGQVRTGIEALVFFLGGPHVAGQAPTGFAASLPQAPLSTANSKKGPYYAFDAKRFIDPETKQATLQFRDPWGTPYAYFSSGAAGGDKYDATYVWTIPDRTDGRVLGPFRLGGTANSPWANPGAIQIISAGPDQAFGSPYSGATAATRGEWVPGSGEYSDTVSTVGGLKGNGADDIANFNGGTPLGTAGK